MISLWNVSRREGEMMICFKGAHTAAAMNVVPVLAWMWGEPLGECRRKLGHFAQLAPHPLLRPTVLC